MLQQQLPIVVPVASAVGFWLLVGICPDNWPRRWPPKGPPPPPWGSKVLGAVAGVASGWIFTGASGIGVSSILELAATGVFAFAGAYAARSIAAGLVGAPASEVEMEGAAAFRR